MGRAPDRRCSEEAGAGIVEGRAPALLRGENRQVVDAGRRGVRAGPSAHRNREVVQAHPSPAVQGLQARMSLVTLEASERVGTVRLSRLDKKNALTAHMYEELAAALADAEQRSDVRAVLLHGSEECF